MKYGLIAGVAAIAMVAAVVTASPANAQQYYGGYGQGMMAGYGMMGQGMMGGYGMMGCPLCGPGMMGWGYGTQPANLNLSTNDVKAYLERMVAIMGNPRLTVGPITEKDASTITAEIVTKDKGDVVQQFSVDRHTGIYRPIE